MCSPQKWGAVRFCTCNEAGQCPNASACRHQRSLVGAALVPRQDLLQPLVHGDCEHPVSDLFSLSLQYVLLGWEWHLKGNVCILKVRVVKGIQSPFFNCLWHSGQP